MKKTEIKTVEEAAVRLSAIINTAIDGIITIDEQGYIESANKAISYLFGYSEEELIGRKVNLLMTSPDRENHDSYMQKYYASGKPKIIGIGREVLGRKKDGSTFPIRLAVSETIFEGRRIFTGVIHDLTKVKRAEEEIRQLNQELERKVDARTEELANVVNKLLKANQQLKVEVTERKKAELQLRKREEELKETLEKEKELGELKSRFVSIASHEFRTPLSTILSSASLIGRYTEGEHQGKREKHIGRIRSSVSNLNNILNDVLSLSRLEEGAAALNRENFVIGDVARSIQEEMGMMLKNGQILTINGELDLEVVLDKTYFKNILYNLISNAIKYSDPGTEIRVNCKGLDDHVQLEVIDQGIGIPMDDQKHLFERFFRASNATNIQGTGLGLTIVKHYLDSLGGAVQFESELGSGSKFTVILPKTIK